MDKAPKTEAEKEEAR
jgi:peptide chain release factor subunit 3